VVSAVREAVQWEEEEMARARQTSVSEASQIALEEVTQAAFNGVLRALEARKLDLRRFPGPILIGIIAWPELRQGDLFREAGQGRQ
jgi:hypothetical protein